MEERTKNFVNSVIFASRIFTGLKDKFLAHKLYDKLFNFVWVYSERKGDNVAQYKDQILTAANSLLDTLDYLEHSKTAPTTPLLYARRSLFAFKLQLMKVPAKPQVVKEEKKEVSVSSPVPKPAKKEVNLAGNKEKILNYIKRTPNSRTKDIIYEFNILSERTVKRNLKELVSDGLLHKVAKDKAVYYNCK